MPSTGVINAAHFSFRGDVLNPIGDFLASPRVHRGFFGIVLFSLGFLCARDLSRGSLLRATVFGGTAILGAGCLIAEVIGSDSEIVLWVATGTLSLGGMLLLLSDLPGILRASRPCGAFHTSSSVNHQNLMFVRIVQPPPGPAPKWVRDAWVGVEIWVSQSPEGFVQRAEACIDTLQLQHPQAATWLKSHLLGNLQTGEIAEFIFDRDCCSVLGQIL
jgi:hypothetical protein